MIGLLLEQAYRDLAPPACGTPVLFLLEEFHSLGHMTVIEKRPVTPPVLASNSGRAAGPRPAQALYKDPGRLLANAAAIQIFGVSDTGHDGGTSPKLSGRSRSSGILANRSTNYQAGESTPSMHQKAGGFFTAAGGFSALKLALSLFQTRAKAKASRCRSQWPSSFQIVPLLRPDEIAIQFARETGAALLLVKGRQPMWTLRVDFFNSDWFTGCSRRSRKAQSLRSAVGLHERTPEALQENRSAVRRLSSEFEAKRGVARRRRLVGRAEDSFEAANGRSTMRGLA